MGVSNFRKGDVCKLVEADYFQPDVGNIIYAGDMLHVVDAFFSNKDKIPVIILQNIKTMEFYETQMIDLPKFIGCYEEAKEYEAQRLSEAGPETLSNS